MAWTLGPGAMVAAAFIGPGTVTTAIAAGVTTGAGLLWAVLLSIVATVVLQELALRSALVTQRDLAALMRDLGRDRWWGAVVVTLIIVALGAGNAAYQSGNLLGASLGVNAALGVAAATTGDMTMLADAGSVAIVLVSVLAAALILRNRYHWLERSLVSLVAIMALGFLGLAVVMLPTIVQTPPTFWVPRFDASHITLSLALIGTTVVPYNLFLHATAVRKRWHDSAAALTAARRESLVSILLGGLITIAIVLIATVAAVNHGANTPLESVMQGLDQRFPFYGVAMLGLGLFAAGFTSALAAPVAAGWAVCGAMGWSTEHTSWGFRAVALSVLATGTAFALLATRPDALIISAQATNGLLLPLVAWVLLAVANSERLLGAYRNNWVLNGVGVPVVCLVTGLALRKLMMLI